MARRSRQEARKRGGRPAAAARGAPAAASGRKHEATSPAVDLPWSKPPPRMHRPSTALLDDTIAIWQPRASRRLTREDAREILDNLVGFFSLLHQWELAEREGARATMPSSDFAQESSQADACVDDA